MIAIIDYNTGNIGSIQNMLRKLGVESIITSDPEVMCKASKLILPGVGSFDSGMKKIRKLELFDKLNDLVLKKKIPILGICLGMQLMGENSEEGKEQGFGWMNESILSFKNLQLNSSIPVMGWNYVKSVKPNQLIQDQKAKFYFVHSYYFNSKCENCIATASINGFEYCVAFEKNNIFGVQFHPEKSHKFGMKLLQNFANL